MASMLKPACLVLSVFLCLSSSLAHMLLSHKNEHKNIDTVAHGEVKIHPNGQGVGIGIGSGSDGYGAGIGQGGGNGGSGFGEGIGYGGSGGTPTAPACGQCTGLPIPNLPPIPPINIPPIQIPPFYIPPPQCGSGATQPGVPCNPTMNCPHCFKHKHQHGEALTVVVQEKEKQDNYVAAEPKPTIVGAAEPEPPILGAAEPEPSVVEDIDNY